MQRRLLEGKQQLVSTGELEVGQLSGIVETASGLHLILRTG